MEAYGEVYDRHGLLCHNFICTCHHCMVNKGFSVMKFVLQTYKEKRKIYPYEETTAYYYGPKQSWMKEIKDEKNMDRRRNKISKRVKEKI